MRSENSGFKEHEKTIQLSVSDSGELLPTNPSAQAQVTNQKNSEIPLIVSRNLMRSGRLNLVSATALSLVASYLAIFCMDLIIELFSNRHGVDFNFRRPIADAFLAQLGSVCALVALFTGLNFSISPRLILIGSLLLSYFIPSLNLILLTSPSAWKIEPLGFFFYYGGTRGFFAAVIAITTLIYLLSVMNKKSKDKQNTA